MQASPTDAQGIAALLRASAPFISLTDAIADAILIVSDAGDVLYASERLEDIADQCPTDIVGRPFLDLFHEEDRAQIPQQMKGGGPGVQWSARMLDRDGNGRWMSLGLRRPRGAEPEGTYVLVRPLNDPTKITDAAALFQRALDAANNLVVVTDARREDNPIIFVNDFFLETTGYDEEFVLGRNCRFLQFRPDGTRDEQPEVEHLRQSIKEGQPSAVLMRNYRKNGELFWNELYVTPLFDLSGTLTHFIGVQNDVTERVQALEQQKQKDALLRSFYDTAPMLMGVTALEGEDLVHRSANIAAAEFYGGSPESVVGKTATELGYTECEAARWRQHHREALRTGEPVRFDTAHPWDQDPAGESVRSLSVVINHIAQSDGPPLFSYIVEDVTERQRNDRQRRLLEQAVENTTAAFLITGTELEEPGPVVTYVNQAFTQMSGYTKEDIVGKTPRVLQGPKTDRALLNRLRRQLRAGQSFKGETVNYRKDGTEYVLNWSIEPIRNSSGEIVYWVATQDDVTKHRELEQQVLEVSAREQERIARDLHDGLGQVLTGVTFLTAKVENQLRAEGSDHADELAQIKSHVEDAIAQARALAHGLHPVDAEPDGLLNALAYLADDVEQTYGISCSFIYNRPVFIEEYERAAHLFRIAQEAVANAVRHGEASTVAISLTDLAAEQDPQSAPGQAVLCIEDDGKGISDEALNRGRGMGLYTMRNRARRIGGTLEIGPRPEGGTLVVCQFNPNGTTDEAEG